MRKTATWTLTALALAAALLLPAGAEEGIAYIEPLVEPTAPVEEPAPETVEAEAPAVEAAEEPVTPESAPETAEETDTVRFETPEYDKPDYDNDSEKKE